MNNKCLTLVPIKNMGRLRETRHNGFTEIILPRDGLLDRLVRLVKNTPKVMRIQLDDRGSYVWQVMDGSRTIEEIGRLMDAEFGERAAPVYERLIFFLRILKNNGLISFCYTSDAAEKVPNRQHYTRPG
ncbi:MAG: PqqD family protein [Caldicoprobacterales bacterium]|jgi:hypothetical protein|nr:PqqD family protein [Clostridiales bacterium]